jgi:hypothetical protein
VPETTVNEQIRRTEGGAGRYPIADRVTAPPGSCADGAQYIIIATATGAFAAKENQIAQAVGTNAANGWNYRTLGTLDEGILAYVQDEDAEYKWSGAAWAVYTGAGYGPGGTDVALADGGTGASLSDPNADRILFWDDSAGQVTWLSPGSNISITGTTLDAAASAITAKDEGSTLTSAVTSLDFTGGGVTASNVGGAVTVSVPGSGGITVKDEGSTLTSSLSSMDFVGAGVTATNTGGAVTVTISGGGGGGSIDTGKTLALSAGIFSA